MRNSDVAPAPLVIPPPCCEVPRMRLAIIGDIHHYRLDMHWRHLLSKRVLGHANLYFNRRHRFNHALLEPLLTRVGAVKPDLVLLTGDVTTTSLEDEFHDIATFLKPLSDRFRTLLVPGNHDRYTFRSLHSRRIETLLKHLLPESFPFFEHLTARWHLLALDGARPQVMLSRGQLGRRQLQQAGEQLAALGPGDGLIVACHYPFVVPPGTPPNTFDHALADGRVLGKMLKDCPAKVVYVHGHIHRPWHWAPQNGRPRGMTFINAGAPCLMSDPYPLGQGFWQVEMPDDPAEPLGLVHHTPMWKGPKKRARPPIPVVGPDDWETRVVL